MRRVLLWGMGIDYENALNPIHYEIMKGNIAVEAIVCKKIDMYCRKKDGFRVILKEEIVEHTFDYIIVLSSNKFTEIKREALELGVDEKQIINGMLLHQPLFDFGRYFSLVENPVTIFSDDCWGGIAYSRLNLPFCSPLVNILWYSTDYAKFITDPLFYLDTELQMVEDGDMEKNVYPIGKLGTNEKSVYLRLNHYVDFAEAKKQWDKRKARINYQNIFVKMGVFTPSRISDEEKKKCLEAFESVRYNKVLFCSDHSVNVRERMHTDRFLWGAERRGFVEDFGYNDYMRGNYHWDIDLLKMLNGEKDYSRYI